MVKPLYKHYTKYLLVLFLKDIIDIWLFSFKIGRLTTKSCACDISGVFHLIFKLGEKEWNGDSLIRSIINKCTLWYFMRKFSLLISQLSAGCREC